MRANQRPTLKDLYGKSVIERRIQNFHDAPQPKTLRHDVFGQIEGLIRSKQEDPLTITHSPMSVPHALNAQEQSIMMNSYTFKKYGYQHDTPSNMQPKIEEYLANQKGCGVPINDKIAGMLSSSKFK